MRYSQIIKQTRERLSISREEAATFVGIHINQIWDLESYDNELTMTLSISEFCRLCCLLHLKPYELLDLEPPLRHVSPSELRGRVLEDCQVSQCSVDEFGEQVGWDVQGLIDMPNDYILDMNLDGLKDLCGHLGLNMIEAIPETVAA